MKILFGIQGTGNGHLSRSKIVISHLKKHNIDVDVLIYGRKKEDLWGTEELGQFQKRLNKQRKMEVIHIAVCKLLSDYGYYEFDFIDEDGWPHYKLIKKLPNLKPGEQKILMKKAIINYFIKSNYIN